MKYTYELKVHLRNTDEVIHDTLTTSISYRKSVKSMEKLGNEVGKTMKTKYPSMTYADICGCVDEENNPH